MLYLSCSSTHPQENVMVWGNSFRLWNSRMVTWPLVYYECDRRLARKIDQKQMGEITTMGELWLIIWVTILSHWVLNFIRRKKLYERTAVALFSGSSESAQWRATLQVSDMQQELHPAGPPAETLFGSHRGKASRMQGISTQVKGLWRFLLIILPLLLRL